MLNSGANTKDHRFLLKMSEGPGDWGEFMKVTGLKVKSEGIVKYYEPGESFETLAGNNFTIDDIECERLGRHAREKPLYDAFIDAAAKGQSLTGVGTYCSVLSNGTFGPAYTSVNVVVVGCELPDVESSSGQAMFKVTLAVDGAPIR